MGAIVLDASKVKSYVLPNLEKSSNTMQEAYSTSELLKKEIPNSFSYKNKLKDISIQIYNIRKEIKDTDSMISKKVEKAKKIENKSDNKINTISSLASKIGSTMGAVGGAVIGANTGGIVGAAAGVVVGKKVGKTIADTGAKIAKSVVSGVKKLGSAIVDGFKWVGSKVVSGVKTAAKWVKEKVKSATDWVKDKFEEVKDWTSNAIKNTGAWISNAASATWTWLKDTASTVWTHIKKIGASFVNGVISIVKGLVKLVEAIGDLVILIGSGLCTIGTALYDVGKGAITGNWDWSATKGLWDGTKSVVAYDWTSKAIFDPLYNTKFGKWLDANAYEPFKSDGIVCKILEGVGYVAGVVAISILTCGAGGVAIGGTTVTTTGAMATLATAAGIGKYTAEEWNKNCLSITYGDQEMGLVIDYEKYNEIEKLKEGQSTTITQQLADENGNPIELKFTITKNGDTYSIVDNNGNPVGFNGVKESSTVKGLVVGTIKGAWEGAQYYVGGKIGGAKFTSVTGKMTSPLMKTVSRAGMRVGLDMATGVAEVPFQSLVTMMSEGKNWDEAWKSQGGWDAVKMQAGIAGIASFAGEAFTFKGNLSAERMVKINSLDEDNLLKFIKNADDKTKLLMAQNFEVDKLSQYATSLTKNVDSKRLVPILDNILKKSNVESSIKILSTLSSDQMDNILKNSNKFSNNGISRFIKKTAQLYKNGTEVAIPNQKYNSFYCNFREHGIKHALAVAEYSDKLGKNLDSIDLEETLTAALAHDFGMRGGVIVFDDVMMGKISKKLSKLNLTEQEILDFNGLKGKVMSLDDAHDILTKKLSNGKPLFNEKIFTMNFARSNHPLNSALDIIKYSESLPEEVDKEVVSLLAMTHSKSTSGISYFSSQTQWESCIDKLKQAADFEGVDFDADKLRKMIADSDTFDRLQMEAAIIRDGDAMSPVVVKDGRTLMQEDSYTEIEILKRRDSFEDILGTADDEAKNLKDTAYYSNGTSRNVDDSIAKRIHAGELNTDYDSIMYIDENGKKIYKASVEIKDATEIPYSTYENSIEERLGEIKTYTNFDERSFEIILPKEAEGTALAKWYQRKLNETIDGYIEDLAEDLTKTVTKTVDGKEITERVIDESVKNSQVKFFEQLRNSIVYR